MVDNLEKLKWLNKRMRSLVKEFLLGEFLFDQYLRKIELEERQVTKQARGSGGFAPEEKREIQSIREQTDIINFLEGIMREYAITITAVATHIQTAANNAMNHAIQSAFNSGELSQSQSVTAQQIAQTTKTQAFAPQTVANTMHSSAPAEPEEELERFMERVWDMLCEKAHGVIKQGITSLKHDNNDQHAISKVLESVFQKGLKNCQKHHPIIYEQLAVSCKAHRQIRTQCEARGISPYVAHTSNAPTPTPSTPTPGHR